MPLIETLAIEVGSSIAKSVLKLWLKDYNMASDAGASVVDILKSRTTDKLAQRKASRQFEEIGEHVGTSLLPLFETEGTALAENDRTAIALAVADTLNTVTSEILAQHDLDPSMLTTFLLTTRPPDIYHFNEKEALLYRRIITESATYIVDIASTLPEYSEHTFAEVLKRETQILEKVDLIIQEMQRLREQYNPQETKARFELEYRETIRRELDKLKLFGANVKGASREQSLSVAYVRLSVEQKIVETPEDVMHDRSMWHMSPPEHMMADETVPTPPLTQSRERRSVVLVDEALAQSQRMLIRGDAGSGKTTLLQWIAVNAAARTFKGALQNWNTLTPFYIRLRHHVTSEQAIRPNLPEPKEFPKLISSAITDAIPAGWAHERLLSGQAVVLVDGIDEIPEAQRLYVREWLEELMGGYAQARFILTSRPPAVEGDDWTDWLNAEGFQDALLQPMNMPDIFAFIDHWHEAVAKRISEPQEKAELPHFAQSLKDELERSRPKRDLAKNPLLCAMLCALNRERQQQLPSDRIKLYEACCELLIEQRDKARSILLKDYPAAALEYPQKLLLLQDLAYYMMRNGKSEVEIAQADERFQQRLGSIRSLPTTLSANNSGVLARKLLVERSSIIREPLVGLIDFTHRTFQEFLTAQAILKEGDIGVLVQNAHKDQWREVILLASSLASKKSREDLIVGLINRGETEREYSPSLYLLAATCLETSIEDLGLNVRLKVERKMNTLIPLRSSKDASALASAGELAIPYLMNNDQYNQAIKVACIRALANIGGSEAVKALEGYIQDANQQDANQLYLEITDMSIRSVMWHAWNAFHAEYRTYYAKQVLSHLNSAPSRYNPLSIKGSTSLADFRQFTNLTTLSLIDCNNITDLTALSSLSQLTELNLSGCSQLTNFAPLSSLSQLTTLYLSGCSQLTDLTALSSLSQLITLDLRGCPQLTALTPLTKLPNLGRLYLSDLPRRVTIPQALKGKVRISILD